MHPAQWIISRPGSNRKATNEISTKTLINIHLFLDQIIFAAHTWLTQEGQTLTWVYKGLDKMSIEASSLLQGIVQVQVHQRKALHLDTFAFTPHTEIWYHQDRTQSHCSDWFDNTVLLMLCLFLPPNTPFPFCLNKRQYISKFTARQRDRNHHRWRCTMQNWLKRPLFLAVVFAFKSSL